MSDCREITACRLCQGGLETVLDLGIQCLAGQFMLPSEPDPPAFPLVLGRCVACGLVQLLHTVSPDLMFRNYWYASGMTTTMREHLKALASEAWRMLPAGKVKARRVLDVGCNDHTLLSYIPVGWGHKYGIDPGPVSDLPPGSIHMRGYFPQELTYKGPYDLIFTVACFYDADDPVAFAQAVRDNLSADGLWCVEVGYLIAMLGNTGYDSICHEHLCYYYFGTIQSVLERAGLKPVRAACNDCNGGSMRVYACRQECDAYEPMSGMGDLLRVQGLQGFPWGVEDHRKRLRGYLQKCARRGETVHLLGASTKTNTVLQYCGLDPDLIQAASERDGRKVGRQTPGTHIPIISEQESRMLGPDVYVSFLGHFKQEIVAREKDFLDRGGRLVFGLPTITEVKGGRP